MILKPNFLRACVNYIVNLHVVFKDFDHMSSYLDMVIDLLGYKRVVDSNHQFRESYCNKEAKVMAFVVMV